MEVPAAMRLDKRGGSPKRDPKNTTELTPTVMAVTTAGIPVTPKAIISDAWSLNPTHTIPSRSTDVVQNSNPGVILCMRPTSSVVYCGKFAWFWQRN